LFNEELLAAIRSGSSDLPAFLSDALGAKVRSMPARTLDVLAVGAIASRSFDERFVAAVLGGSEDDYVLPIRDAVLAHVLMAGRSDYQFRHGLFAEAIVADLTPGQRRQRHALIATALEAHPELAEGGRAWVAGEATDHWLAAERPSEAFRSAIDAGLAAATLYAHGIALHRWEQALSVADNADDATRGMLLDAAGLGLTDLLMRGAQAAALTGDFDRAIALAERALSQEEASTTPDASGVLRSEYARILWAAGRFELADRAFREAAELATAHGTVAQRAQVMGRYALILLFRSQLDEGIAVAREAAALAEQAELSAVEAAALDALGNGLHAQGSVSEAIVRLRQALDAARRSGDAEEQLFISDSLAECLIDADQLEEAIRVARSAAEDARRYGLDRTFGAMFRGNAAFALFELGRWAEAETMTNSGLEFGYGRVWAHCVRARLLAAMGRSAEAGAVLSSVEAMYPEGLPELGRLEVALATAEQHLLDGSLLRALSTALDGLDIGMPHVGLRLDLAMAGLQAAADLVGRSRGRRDEAEARNARSGTDRCIGEVVAQQRILDAWDTRVASKIAAGQQADAELARLEGRPDPDRWAAAATDFAAVGMPYRTAYARYRQSEAMLTLGGVRAEVGPPLREAYDTCRDMGAKPLAAAIEGLARKARVDLTAPRLATDVEERPTVGGPEPRASSPRVINDLGLSRRELEILGLVAEGRTNGQIARELFISPKTASVHITHILDKLGASNRAEAAMIAERAGLLDPEAPSSEDRR
jgi:DNA-binding CsgD family transcriptional regulator/tetratricopeptide (TPR) repeat protein